MKIVHWVRGHTCVRSALRTFVQTAAGVLVAAVINAAGVVEDIDVSAVVAVAVATGLSAVMNRNHSSKNDDDSDEDAADKS